MQSGDELRRILGRIDGRGYKAYLDLRGAFELGPVTLFVDHVQGDPFAAPSKLRARIPLERAALPDELLEGRVRRVALCDFLARQARAALGPPPRRRGGERERGERRGSGKSGQILVDAGAQEVLERSAVALGPDWVELRLQVGLPAAGRRILGGEAEALLCERVPEVAERALCLDRLPAERLRGFVDCVVNQEHLRALLEAEGLVAFVGDGAVLPRESGASDRPLRAADAVPFESPASLRVELPLARPAPAPGGGAGTRRALTGMGIPRGVTLIAGGGYHGKSTLLRALERGVYPHVPGDGREWVVSAPGLVKIRAEDGRRVEQVDIAAFIGALPGGRSTEAFSSEDASGSTSQAANIVEAVEAGATGLLLDEDTCATNFMVRDARMQALVAAEHEPITPFLDRVRELHDALGISTILVMGGCGDYFDVADRVIAMRDFRPLEVSDEARRIAAEHPGRRRREAIRPLTGFRPRVPVAASLDPSRGRREVRIDARGVDQIHFGRETIELRGVEQLVDPSQTRAVGYALHLAAEQLMDGRSSLREVIERLDALFDERGLDALDPFQRPGQHPGNFARPRALEIAAAINRLRTVRMRVPEPGAPPRRG